MQSHTCKCAKTQAPPMHVHLHTHVHAHPCGGIPATTNDLTCTWQGDAMPQAAGLLELGFCVPAL